MTGAPAAVTLTRNRDAQGRYTGYGLSRGTESLTSATYTFDAAGRIATADNVTFGYEPHTSRVQTLTHALADGKTLVSQTAFDGNRSAIASVAHTVKTPGQADTLVSRIAYTTNALGQRTGVERSGTAWGTTQNVSYGYDTLGQVTSAQSTVPAETSAYAYDPIGNRLTSTEGTAPPKTYAANNLNQYTTIEEQQQPFAPVYDLDGNMLDLKNQTGEWDMTWNGDGALAARRWRRATKWSSPERERRGSWRRVPLGRRQEQNRLVEMTKPDQRLVFAYDYMGRRWKKEVYSGTANNWTLQSSHRYLYDGFVQITELDAQATYAPTRSYRWDPTVGQATRVLSMTLHGANAQTLAFTHDGNKNTDSLIAADGSLVGHYAYGPFGQVITSIGSLASANPYRFSSEFEDGECGLVYYNFRYYITNVGRWLSRDSIGERGGINVFCLLNNNSINVFDKNGLIEGASPQNINITSEGFAEPQAPALKKCTILIRFDHFGASAPGNFADLRERDFKNAPPCSKIGYVGCGGNFLNQKVPSDFRVNIPSYPEDALEEKEKNQLRNLGINEDDIGKIGGLNNGYDALSIAIDSARKDAPNLCGKCCASIVLRVSCIESTKESYVLHKLNEFVKSGGSPFDFDFESARNEGAKQDKCGKVSVFNCKNKQWDEWR